MRRIRRGSSGCRGTEAERGGLGFQKKGLRGQERGRRGEEGQSEGAGAFPEGEKPCSVGHPVKEDGLLHRSTFTLLRIL